MKSDLSFNKRFTSDGFYNNSKKAVHLQDFYRHPNQNSLKILIWIGEIS
jgi:hypothetical protein